MWFYVFKRMLAMIPTLIGVVTLTFLITQIVPGGPVDQALTQTAAYRHAANQTSAGAIRVR